MMSDQNIVYLTEDKLVWKEVIKEGEGEDLPSKGCRVAVQYTGKLTNGKVFDQIDRPFEFDLDEEQVIDAFDIAVGSMKLHEKCVMTCDPKYAYGAFGSKRRIPPNSTLIFELEMLGWKGKDVSPKKDGSIMLKLLKPYSDSFVPSDYRKMKVHLKGIYKDEIFEEREVEFDHGDGAENGIVEGVEIAILSVPLHGSAELQIKSKYAFGKKGNEALNIPPNADVTYIVKLLECEEVSDSWQWSHEKCVEEGTRLKDKGTSYFKLGKFEVALKSYRHSLEVLPDCRKVKDGRLLELSIAILGNIALCQQKLNNYQEALSSCEEVLKLAPENVKAFYRSGQCSLALLDYTGARNAFQKVLDLEPENNAAKSYLQTCKLKIRESYEDDKKKYANMFVKLSEGTDEQITPLPNDNDVLAKCGEWTDDDANDIDQAFERDNNIFMI